MYVVVKFIVASQRHKAPESDTVREKDLGYSIKPYL